MNLCVHCGRIDGHRAGCPDHPLRIRRDRINREKAERIAARILADTIADTQTYFSRSITDWMTEAAFAALTEKDQQS